MPNAWQTITPELGLKLPSMIISLRAVGVGINIHVARGVLMGLVQPNPEKFDNFHVSRSWFRSLYQRRKFSRRATTTPRPIKTHSLWIEVKSPFIHISDKVLLYNISDESIVHADQTPSKYVAIDSMKMVTKGGKHICQTGSNDRRSITLALNGTNLLFQLICKRKTARSLPNIDFPDGFTMPHYEKHWSNETEIIRLNNNVLVPKNYFNLGYIRGTTNYKI